MMIRFYIFIAFTKDTVIGVSTRTVEPPVAITSRKRPLLLSNQFSKIPHISKSNHYIWNLLYATTSRKQL